MFEFLVGFNCHRAELVPLVHESDVHVYFRTLHVLISYDWSSRYSLTEQYLTIYSSFPPLPILLLISATYYDSRDAWALF